jgi:hypothetical protein
VPDMPCSIEVKRILLFWIGDGTPTFDALGARRQQIHLSIYPNRILVRWQGSVKKHTRSYGGNDISSKLISRWSTRKKGRQSFEKSQNEDQRSLNVIVWR